MKEKTITLEKLGKILDLTPNTLRVYLSRPELLKFAINSKSNRARKTIYLLNDAFIKELCIFFSIKRYYDKINLLQKFWTDKIKV